jgi:hypothetical protein
MSFDVFIYQYIALRWSAKQWPVEKSINIWLLRSQNIVWLAAPLRYYSILRATQMIETPNGKFM